MYAMSFLVLCRDSLRRPPEMRYMMSTNSGREGKWPAETAQFPVVEAIHRRQILTIYHLGHVHIMIVLGYHLVIATIHSTCYHAVAQLGAD